MTPFSSVLGLFAFVGALSVLRWAFGGRGDTRPRIDLVTERINARAGGLDKTGTEEVGDALYPATGFEECPTCRRLHRGGHGYAGQVDKRASGPVCLPIPSAAPERSNVVTMPTRRAS